MTNMTRNKDASSSRSNEANTDSPSGRNDARYMPPRLQKIGELVESTGLPVTEFTLPDAPIR
jgi:hypothetical protein